MGTSDINPADDAFTAHIIRSSKLTCPRCRYDLSGVREPRCSECGEALILQLIRDDETPRWHTLVVIGLSMFVAVLFYVTVVAISGFKHNRLDWIPKLTLFFIVVASLILWLRHRNAIVAIGTSRPFIVGIASWVILIVALIITSLWMSP